MLRHERLVDVTHLPTAITDIPGDLALGNHSVVFLDEALPHPPGRLTLLARRVPVGLKPRVDQRVIRAELR